MTNPVDEFQEMLIKTDHRNHRKSHCANGHEFTEANTKWLKNNRGHLVRICRECKRARKRKYRLRIDAT